MKTILLISILLFSFNKSNRIERINCFISSIQDEAETASQKTGVPLAIVIAQSCLETGYGKSKLCRESCNHFGVRRNHKFMTYKNMGSSFNDYVMVLNQNCYLCHGAKTIDEHYKALIKCNYSGGSYERRDKYVRKLKWIVKRFGLNELN